MAEQSAQRHLTQIEPYWARAWKGVLRGQLPAPPKGPGHEQVSTRPPRMQIRDAWSVLGVLPNASLEEVRRAFRKRALETHPDHGGDPALFRELSSAHEKVMAKLRVRARRAAR